MYSNKFTNMYGIFQLYAKNVKTDKMMWFDLDNADCSDFGQSYVLFAWLAGVNNNFNIQPISQPRGLPQDVKEQMDDVGFYPAQISFFRATAKRLNVWLGSFCHSYLTGAEILDAVKLIPIVNIPGVAVNVDLKTVLKPFIDTVELYQYRFGTVRFVFGFE